MTAAARRWCFADQLGPHFLDRPDRPVLFVESRAVFERPYLTVCSVAVRRIATMLG